MKSFIKWLGNNSTNILATIYIILVQIVAAVFHICKIWVKNSDWPVKCLIAIDKPAKWLSQLLAKQKKEA